MWAAVLGVVLPGDLAQYSTVARLAVDLPKRELPRTMNKRTGLAGGAILLLLAPVVASWLILAPREGMLPLPAPLVAAESAGGRQLLSQAQARADFDDLQAHFERQWLKSYCGVASSVAVLRALGKEVTQPGFFTPETAAVRSGWRVAFSGMTLEALGGLLAAHGALARVHHADSLDEQSFRLAVQRNLSSGGDFMIVNYERAGLGQQAGGHISPLAAYDSASDSVLILDTASYKYPQTWSPLPLLFRAMSTLDSESGKMRGYVEVSGLKTEAISAQ